MRALVALSMVALFDLASSQGYLIAGCTTQNKIMNCEDLLLTEIPADIPDSFTRLLLKNNNINDNSGTELVRCNGNPSPCGSGALHAVNTFIFSTAP